MFWGKIKSYGTLILNIVNLKFLFLDRLQATGQWEPGAFGTVQRAGDQAGASARVPPKCRLGGAAIVQLADLLRAPGEVT